MSEKSQTCFGKVSGKPLTVYRSRAEADESARYVEGRYGRAMVSYQCETCGEWHLSPSERQTSSTQRGCCIDRNGRPKAAYASRKGAERRAAILLREQGVSLSVYPCPNGGGWHLTKG